jgi:hypothetical protein
MLQSSRTSLMQHTTLTHDFQKGALGNDDGKCQQ